LASALALTGVSFVTAGHHQKLAQLLEFRIFVQLGNLAVDGNAVDACGTRATALIVATTYCVGPCAFYKAALIVDHGWATLRGDLESTNNFFGRILAWRLLAALLSLS